MNAIYEYAGPSLGCDATPVVHSCDLITTRSAALLPDLTQSSRKKNLLI
jgi:N-acetylglutamate synthase-like GNAT family acetyltransferase